MHSLLERQLRKCRAADGSVDVDQLIARVDAAYAEHDAERRFQERAHNLMGEELSKATAHRMQEAERQLDLLLSVLGDGVLVCEESGTVRSANAAAEMIFGASAIALEGQHIDELLDVDRASETSIAGVKRGDGADVRVEVTRSEALLGEARAQIVIVRDVTERQSFERRLRASRALLGSVIENIPHGIIVKDVRDDMSILLCNRAAVAMFGFAPDEAVGQRARDLMPASVADETAADEARVRADKAPLYKTVYRRSRSGEDLTIEKRLIPLLDDEGHVSHILEIFENVTGIREQERRLREAKDQAEAANRAKSAFLATMSHEIRTPMNGVLGMTALLLDSALDDKQRRFAKLIKVSAENLLVIINDILDMSKIEAGRLSIEEGEYDVRRLCQAAVDVTRPRADAKSIAVKLEIPADLSRARRGDGDRLRQILVNLLGNAVKFTDRGSVCLRVVEGGTPASLRFAVTDTGIGIPPGDHDKLFREFVQVDSSATRRFGGTGLGLAISKKLVVLMGGTIGVDSEPGKGSTFWFEIPAPEGTPDTQKASRPSLELRALSAWESMRVLVAEDNPINQEVVKGYLEKAGCRVTLAGNGREALELLQRGSFALVLMDMQMPELDGLEATRAIRALSGPVARVPIVMLTANAMKADRDSSLEAGADDHLAKPIDRTRLLELIATIAEQNPAPPPRRPTSMPPPMAEVDLRQVGELEAALGAERLAQLIEKARGSFRQHLDRIEAAIAQGDREAVSRSAHALVGSAGSLGLAGASKAARALEIACGEAGKDLRDASARLGQVLRGGFARLDERQRERGAA